jgi:hypothetical protein
MIFYSHNEIFTIYISVLAPDAFPFSVTELRLLTILQQIPFVIPFDTRVQVNSFFFI